MPIGIELDITPTGNQLAVQFHPDPGLGAHQLDRPGVHAAQGRGVDRQLRLGAAVIGPCSGVEGGGIDVIASGDDGQVFRLDLGVDPGAAGDDFEAVDVVRIQARAFD
ncbi:hypothetical protein, partial [Pseudomonas prosekii]|uniref:hypothetical protein n=1 Tax=Pseudomonas prosekii TaxID=1148509 RepID=UPI0039655EBD